MRALLLTGQRVADDDTGAIAREILWVVARIGQGLHGHVERKPVCDVGLLEDLLWDSAARPIEVETIDDRSARTVRRVRGAPVRIAVLRQREPFVRHPPEALAAGENVLPELSRVSRVRVSATQADNRDGANGAIVSSHNRAKRGWRIRPTGESEYTEVSSRLR